MLTRSITEIQRAMRVDDIRTRSLALGAAPLTGTPQEFGAFIRAEIPEWANVIKASGARLD